MNLYGHNSPTSDIMLQVFYWDSMWGNQPGRWYKYIETKIGEISEAGIKMVWMPPPSKSRVPNFVGYTPMDYYDLGEFEQWVQDRDDSNSYHWSQHPTKSTLYGTKDELLSLITKLKSQNIRPIADIVLNHRAGQQHNEEGERIRWKGAEHQVISGKMAWGYGTNDPPEITKGTGGGHVYDDGGTGFGGNLAHGNTKVREEIRGWLKWLKEEIGFEGWRYDYVKGYSPQHIGEYNYHTNPYVSIGEYWDGAQPIYDWIDRSDAYDLNKKSMAFDFPLQNHLKEIFWGGKPFRELAGWRNSAVSIMGGWPGKAVTFLDNHDTYRKGFQDFPSDDKRLVQGYALLLTHPGIPCIFWNHLFERGSDYAPDKIKALGRFRVESNITNQAHVEIIVANHDCYVARINDNVIMKIGDCFWSPFGLPGNWILKMSGEGWAVWKS